MITPEKVAELRSAFPLPGKTLKVSLSLEEVLDTIEALWKENAELKELIANQDREHDAKDRMWGKALRDQHIIVERLNVVANAAEEQDYKCPQLQMALKSLREGKP